MNEIKRVFFRKSRKEDEKETFIRSYLSQPLMTLIEFVVFEFRCLQLDLLKIEPYLPAITMIGTLTVISTGGTVTSV